MGTDHEQDEQEQNANEPVIRFSVRDLLARVDGRLDQLTQTLGSLATKSEVASLERRLIELEVKELRRETMDKHDEKATTSKISRRQWVIGTLVSIAFLTAMLLPYLIPVH